MISEKKLMHTMWEEEKKCWGIFLTPENPTESKVLPLSNIVEAAQGILDDEKSKLKSCLGKLFYFSCEAIFDLLPWVGESLSKVFSTEAQSVQKVPSVKHELEECVKNFKDSSNKTDFIKKLHEKFLKIFSYLSFEELIKVSNQVNQLLLEEKEIEKCEMEKVIKRLVDKLKQIGDIDKDRTSKENFEEIVANKLKLMGSDVNVEEFVKPFMKQEKKNKKSGRANPSETEVSWIEEIFSERNALETDLKSLPEKLKSFAECLVDKIKEKIELEFLKLYLNSKIDEVPPNAEDKLKPKIAILNLPQKNEVQNFFEGLINRSLNEGTYLLIEAFKKELSKNRTYATYARRQMINSAAVYVGHTETQQLEGGYWSQRIFNILGVVLGAFAAYYTYERLITDNDQRQKDYAYEVFKYSTFSLGFSLFNYYWNLHSTYKEKKEKNLYGVMQNFLQRADLICNEIIKKELIVSKLINTFILNQEDKISFTTYKNKVEIMNDNKGNNIEELFFSILKIIDAKQNFNLYTNLEAVLAHANSRLIKIILYLFKEKFIQEEDTVKLLSEQKGLSWLARISIEQKEARKKYCTYLIHLLTDQYKELITATKLMKLISLLDPELSEKLEDQWLKEIKPIFFDREQISDVHFKKEKFYFFKSRSLVSSCIIGDLSIKIEQLLKEEAALKLLKGNLCSSNKSSDEKPHFESLKPSSENFQKLLRQILDLDIDSLKCKELANKLVSMK